VTIAGDTIAYMYKNELPTYVVVAAIFMTIVGAYVAKNVVKGYQLGRKFTVAPKAEASKGGYTQVPTQN
jgi:hypothetical protein